jgi:hypothetical protein
MILALRLLKASDITEQKVVGSAVCCPMLPHRIHELKKKKRFFYAVMFSDNL